MNTTIKKYGKTTSTTKINSTEVSFGGGKGGSYWINIFFSGKEQKGINTIIEVQMEEKECLQLQQQITDYLAKMKISMP